MQTEDIVEELVAKLEKSTRIQTNITNTLVRQSTLIARLNDRVIKLEQYNVRNR